MTILEGHETQLIKDFSATPSKQDTKIKDPNIQEHNLIDIALDHFQTFISLAIS